MPRKAKDKRFASEAEEAAWWEANEGVSADAFEKRLANGYRGPAYVVITGDSTVTKIRLSAKDVALASKQAKSRGVRCHEHLKSLFHKAIQKKSRAKKTAS